MTGRTIAEIFKGDGEARFRDLETALLEQTLSDAAMKVVAAGGGVVEREQNRRLLKSSGLTIYLELPAAEAAARVQSDQAVSLGSGAKGESPAERPLFQGAVDLGEVEKRLLGLLKRREPFYREADLIVPCAQSGLGRSVEEIVAAVERAIDSPGRT